MYHKCQSFKSSVHESFAESLLLPPSLLFFFPSANSKGTLPQLYLQMLEEEGRTCSALCQPQVHALAWLSDCSIRWPRDESTCARERDNVGAGLTTDEHSKCPTRWAPKGKEDTHNLLLPLVSASRHSCLVLILGKREQQQSAEANHLRYSLSKQETTSDKWPFGSGVDSPSRLTRILHRSAGHPWGHLHGEGCWEHQSIDKRNMVWKGTSGLTWMKVLHTNKLHLFKGQVRSNMLLQTQTGKQPTQDLVSKTSPWLPATLQGLFFLQGRSGKLINLGRGIYYQDENFACKFCPVAKKVSFQRKKVWEKMSVSSIKNCWNPS